MAREPRRNPFAIERPPTQEYSLARVEGTDQDLPLPSKIDLALFRRLFSWTRPYRGLRNWLLLIVVVRSLQLPLLAWSIGAIIQGPIARHDVQGAVLGAVGFIGLALFTQVTMHFRQRLALDLGEYVVRDLRLALFRHLMTLPMSFYNRYKTGSIISRCTSDVENLRIGVQNVLFVSLVQTGQMLGAGALMAWYNWRLFLLILAMTPLLYHINRHFRRKIVVSSRELHASFSRITATLVESVKGIRVTQGFSRERRNGDLFRQLLTDHSGYNMGLARNVAVFLPLLELNSQVFIAMTLLVGGYGVLSPSIQMDLGSLIVFFFLAQMFFDPIRVIGHQFTEALNALAGAERVFSVLDTKPDWQDPEDARPLDAVRGDVEFREVVFGYAPDRPVLHGITFVVPAGQSVALVGHTGSGKSSIVNLLCKFYLPQGGEIYFDGHPVSKATTSSVRAHLGLVLQQNFLFTGTVMENIRLGNPGASDAQVVDAVRQLDCLDIVEALPQGFQTVVGERGTGLSLGQQQLLCFARALLADPAILVLDEATSSVDTLTELRIQTALERLRKGRTSFIIAHRLSTIRNADLVLVLDHGHIVERGRHNELLQAGGHYARLYSKFAEQ